MCALYSPPGGGLGLDSCKRMIKNRTKYSLTLSQSLSLAEFPLMDNQQAIMRLLQQQSLKASLLYFHSLITPSVPSPRENSIN